MNAEQELERIGLLTGRIRRNKDRLGTLKETAADIRLIGYSGRIPKLADLEAKTTADLAELERQKGKLCSMISSIDNEKCAELLYLRYVRCLNYYEISDSMCYSLRMVHRIHAKALELMQQRLEPETT